MYVRKDMAALLWDYGVTASVAGSNGARGSVCQGHDPAPGAGDRGGRRGGARPVQCAARTSPSPATGACTWPTPSTIASSTWLRTAPSCRCGASFADVTQIGGARGHLQRAVGGGAGAGWVGLRRRHLEPPGSALFVNRHFLSMFGTFGQAEIPDRLLGPAVVSPSTAAAGSSWPIPATSASWCSTRGPGLDGHGRGGFGAGSAG